MGGTTGHQAGMRILRKVRIPTAYTRSEILRFIPVAQRRPLQRLARQLKGQRIVHVNATAVGGGVAEIMQSFVPYLRAFGIACDWYAIDPKQVPAKFFQFTNRLHNALQGIPVRFSARDWRDYRHLNQILATELAELPYDVLVVNDPQPVLAGSLIQDSRPKIYISHIDTSAAHLPVWKKIMPAVRAYDAIVFSNRAFVHHSIGRQKLHIFTPAIDPLALKQRLVPSARARRQLARYRLPIKDPWVVQVSRFDVWKNPLGLVQAHHYVHQAMPNVHTIFVGLKEAKDNPEADRVYKDVVRVAEAHRNIHLFFEPWGIKSIPEFTMLIQNAADVIVQNSIKEGFGLTVTEAMWKSKPVVGGPASGIKKQIRSGKNGFIAKDSEALAKTIIRLLQKPALRRRIGKSAHASVQRHYLMSRLVLDHLKLYAAELRARR